MGVVYRSSSSVTNGTAGTSVVVTKPSGVIDGDHLTAVIAVSTTGSITAPAGWSLVGSQTSTFMRVSVYRKLAASEGASWTWTIGASVINLGYCEAHTGVDVSDPVESIRFNTDFYTIANVTGIWIDQLPAAQILPGYAAVAGAAARRNATGAATAWLAGNSADGTERADLSTNTGAGGDITMCVFSTAPIVTEDVDWRCNVRSTLDQLAAVHFEVILRPTFTAYAGELLEPIVEIAPGADTSTDPETWPWVDISADVREDPGITIIVGRTDASSQTRSTQVTLNLDNTTGDYTFGAPNGAHFPDLDQSTPLRVSVPYGYTPPTVRALVFIESAEPGWDESTNDAIVSIIASGRIRQSSQGNAPAESATYRKTMGGVSLTDTPAEYWPCEDETGAASLGSAVGGFDMVVSGVDVGSSSDIVGSYPLPVVHDGDTMFAKVRPYTPTGMWGMWLATNIESAIPADAKLMEIRTNGTANRWEVWLTAASAIQIIAYDTVGNLILSASDSVTATIFDGYPMLAGLTVEQDGTDILWGVGIAIRTNTDGTTGTLAGYTHGNVISVQTRVTAGLEGKTLGHYTLLTNYARDDWFGAALNVAPALTGNIQDTADGRIQRPILEDGVDVDFIALAHPRSRSSALMSAQPAGTTLGIIRSAEALDHGTLYDGMANGGYVYVNGRARYNGTVRLTVDMAQSQLRRPFAPVFDDRGTFNDWTISRSGGLKARVSDEEHVARTKVRRRNSAQLELYDEQWQAFIAGWRVGLGTTPGPRYPQILVDLRGSPELTEEWLTIRPGHRMQLVNLMAQHPSTSIADVIIEGWQETFRAGIWQAVTNCSPAAPNEVGVWDDTVKRWGSNFTALAASMTTTATTAVASVSAGKILWATTDLHPTYFPFDIGIGGEQITVSASAGAAADSFGRNTANGWGSPDVGPAWVRLGGVAADFSTTTAGSAVGIIAMSTTATERWMTLDIGYAEMRAEVILTTNTIPVGAVALYGLGFRMIDANNYYLGCASIDTAGAITAQIRKRAAGVQTTLATTVTDLNIADNIICEVDGSGDWQRLRLWRQADPKPLNWTLEIESISALNTATIVGCFARREAGNTSPTSCEFDGFAVTNPQTFTVTRSVNDVVKTHATGDKVSLWTPARFAL